jgi:hypothetical protein
VDIARDRLRNQGLVGRGFDAAEDVVRWMGAVQAQDYPGAKLGLGLRAPGLTAQAIDTAFSAGRFLRTHVLRPTWHFVAPEDIRWLLALTGPRVLAGSRRRMLELELDDATLRRGDEVLVAALEGGRSRTRRDLGGVLAAAGIPPTGQRLPYLLAHAELVGLICSGELQGRQQTFALLDARAPQARPRDRDDALGELAGRYFASHGPATVHDFAWWSGLTIADGRRGLEVIGPRAERTDVAGTTYWAAEAAGAPKPAGAVVHLLPYYDELTVAYRDHATSIDPRAAHVFGGWAAGVLGNVVARNGLIVGSWRRVASKATTAVEVNLAVGLSAREREALRAAVARHGESLGQPIAISGAA